MSDELWCENCQTRLDLAAHDAEVAAKARREALEEAALSADNFTHTRTPGYTHVRGLIAGDIRMLINNARGRTR